MSTSNRKHSYDPRTPHKRECERPFAEDFCEEHVEELHPIPETEEAEDQKDVFAQDVCTASRAQGSGGSRPREHDAAAAAAAVAPHSADVYWYNEVTRETSKTVRRNVQTQSC